MFQASSSGYNSHIQIKSREQLTQFEDAIPDRRRVRLTPRRQVAHGPGHGHPSHANLVCYLVPTSTLPLALP